MEVILGVDNARYVTELQKHPAKENTSSIGIRHLEQMLTPGTKPNQLGIAYRDGIFPVLRSIQQSYPVFTLHNGSCTVTKEFALPSTQSASPFIENDLTETNLWLKLSGHQQSILRTNVEERRYRLRSYPSG